LTVKKAADRLMIAETVKQLTEPSGWLREQLVEKLAGHSKESRLQGQPKAKLSIFLSVLPREQLTICMTGQPKEKLPMFMTGLQREQLTICMTVEPKEKLSMFLTVLPREQLTICMTGLPREQLTIHMTGQLS
jgi:hypothetical protein